MSGTPVIPLLSIAAVLLGMAWSAGAQTVSEAGEGQSKPGAVDCTDVSVDFLDDPRLTREEKIALMDQALMESLAKFDLCQTSQASSQANGGGAGAGGGAGGGAGSGNSGGQGAGGQGSGGQGSGGEGGGAANSVASSDMSGTETGAGTQTASAPGSSSGASASGGSASGASGQEASASRPPSGTRNAADGATDEKDSQSGATENATKNVPGSGIGAKRQVSNGKIPEDIPPADNDSVLEAQIREAAMNEPDPVVREKLWDEYRKYKGIPTKGGG